MFQTFFKKAGVFFGVFFMALAIFCSFTITSSGMIDVPQAMADDHKKKDKHKKHDEDKDSEDKHSEDKHSEDKHS